MQPISLPNLAGLALVASLALAAPAAASGGIYCEGDNVALELSTGRLPVLHIFGIFAEIDGMAWSSGPERGEGTPIVVGQAFGDGQQVLVDLTDPDLLDIIISVRLRFDGDEDWPLTGTLTANDKTHSVRCGEG